MRTPTGSLATLVVVLTLFGGACGDDDSAHAPDDTKRDRGPVEAPTGGFVELAVLDTGSPYLQGLCTIDFFDPGDEEDPMGWLVGELGRLPTSTPAESEEVEWMIERIRRSDKVDDPLATDDLTSVAAVLRARCS